MKKTCETKKTVDEILDSELSGDMVEYLNDNQIFREYIKDAMYAYATQCQQDNDETFIKFINEHYSHSSETYRNDLIKSYNQFLTLNKQ